MSARQASSSRPHVSRNEETNGRNRNGRSAHDEGADASSRRPRDLDAVPHAWRQGTPVPEVAAANLLAQALRLPEALREELVAALLDSLEPPPGLAIEDHEEIERRAKQARQGLPGVLLGGSQRGAEDAIRFRRAATRELGSDIRYYNNQSPRRGQTLAHAVERTLIRIAESPRLYPLLYKPDIRSAKVERFLCHVVYVLRGDDVEVLAVAHANHLPPPWRRRRMKKRP